MIGAWLRGERLQDLKHVKAVYFDEPEIVRLLQSGMMMLDIGIRMNNITQLARLSTIYGDALYKQALTDLMRTQIMDECRTATNPIEIKSKIEYMEAVLAEDEKAEEAEDPVDMFRKEMEARANRVAVKYERMPSLNNMTAGIKRKELTTVAARTSVGKSAFTLQIANGAWKQGAKVLYFPLEMSVMQTYGRLMIANGFLDPKELQTGKVKNELDYQNALDDIRRMHESGRFKIYEGQGQIEKIENTIKTEKPFLVVIDQLSQMRANVPFRDLRLQFSYMTSNLKRIAMQEDVAIILVCQINRDGDGTKPTMANLKESGSIEEDSDNVILLHRYKNDERPGLSAYDGNEVRPMCLDLAKQRDGETGEIDIEFAPRQMTFYEVVNE